MSSGSSTSTRSPREAPADAAGSQQRSSLPTERLNQVQLVGRVAADPVTVELPSGDEVVTLRLVVERGPGARRPPSVDTIDCAAWTAKCRRTASTWVEGDVVSIEGSLRRRFWRGPQGAQSRYEVEVSAARRLKRA
ncbi:MAG TPA: single-stranded DNA-binding protein [Actinomycetes bacterium]|nr:single-stranded DNA-binding protein [Actinomycetes bacterium]